MNNFLETPQWKSGTSVADYLDEYFRARGWVIEPTTRHQERDLCLGDRKFYRDGTRCFMEYKSGIQTGHTGNVFFETVSVDTAEKPGWVYTCKADYICYAALLNQKLLIFVPETLREHIEDLKTKFRTVSTNKGQNATYRTHGVLVPLEYAETHLAARVLLTGEVVQL